MADTLLDRVPFSTGYSKGPGPQQDPPWSPSVPDRVPFGTPDRVLEGTPNLSLELATRTFQLLCTAPSGAGAKGAELPSIATASNYGKVKGNPCASRSGGAA